MCISINEKAKEAYCCLFYIIILIINIIFIAFKYTAITTIIILVL